MFLVFDSDQKARSYILLLTSQ